MKQYIVAVFESRLEAEKSINALHTEHKIDTNEISYLYRNTDNEIKEVEASEVTGSTPAEGAKQGAVIGGSIGLVAGLATVAGLIPVIGPVFAAGPLISALGIGAGAVGTAAAGGVTGAAAGSLVGALSAWSTNQITEDKAKEYEDKIMSGNVLVAIHTDHVDEVIATFRNCNAISVDAYTPTP